MVIRCGNCGTLNTENQKNQICTGCGYPLVGEVVQMDAADIANMQAAFRNSEGIYYEGVGYYTKRLAMLVIPYTIIAFLMFLAGSYSEHLIADPLADSMKSEFFTELFMVISVWAIGICYLVQSIAICVKRGMGLLKPTYVYYDPYDGHERVEGSLLIVILDIIILGIVPIVAFFPALINSIREIAGKSFDKYSIHSIERATAIATIIVLIVGIPVGIIGWSLIITIISGLRDAHLI